MKVILKKKMHAADLPIENNLLKICKNVSILIARCFEFEFFLCTFRAPWSKFGEHREHGEYGKGEKISTG